MKWQSNAGCSGPLSIITSRAAIPFSVGILAGGAAGLGYPRANPFPVHPSIPFPKGVPAEPGDSHHAGGTAAPTAAKSHIPGVAATARGRKKRLQSGTRLQQLPGRIWLEKAGKCSGNSAGAVPGGDSSAQGHLSPGWAHTDV